VDQTGCSPRESRHYTEMFGSGSSLAEWVSEAHSHCQAVADHCAESDLEYDGTIVHIVFLALKTTHRISGFALLISNAGQSMLEGGTVVTREQWHDIKNHLGGLKLYATFLRKRITSVEEQPIVDKILKAINGLIDHLARIRRGE
jgi:hypothetical protein